MTQPQHLDPAVEPLKNILRYLTEVVRLDERVFERVAEYQLANGLRFAVSQHELTGLPGVACDRFDEDGAIWLAVERLKRVDPPPIDDDLKTWLGPIGDPEQKPAVQDSVLITVDAERKDFLLSTGQARPQDC